MIPLLFFVVGTFYVIREAETTSWKIKNAVIVLGSALVGFFAIYGFTYLKWGPGASDSLILMALFAIAPGFLGCIGAAAGNQWRKPKVERSRSRNDKTVI